MRNYLMAKIDLKLEKNDSIVNVKALRFEGKIINKRLLFLFVDF